MRHRPKPDNSKFSSSERASFSRKLLTKATYSAHYFGLRLLVVLIDASVIGGKRLKKILRPVSSLINMTIKNIFLGSILNSYFIFLKLKKRTRLVATSATHKLFNTLNVYIYKITVVVIIIITIGVSLSSRTLSAEELRSNTIISQLVAEIDETSNVLIEEGPLTNTISLEQLSYVDSDTVIFEELIPSTYAPDTDNDDLFAITEGDSAIIAPIITDTDVVLQGTRNTVETYIVKSGDTISTIAQQFGVSTNTILWQNDLQYYNTIKPGQTLSILPTSGVVHDVKSGETIGQIAKKYQAEVDEIIARNKLADANDIQIGEKLIIPDGIKPTAVVYRPPARSLPTVIKDIFVPSSASAINTGGKLLWPVNSTRITQYYHLRHSAIDIGDKSGKPIFAAEAGKVERSGWTTGYGYNIIINHGGGLKTLYAHNSKNLVSIGDTVARGDTIALIGSTGWSTGPHVHFEVISNGRKTNPLNYIR